MREWFNYRLEQTGTFETRLECGIGICVESSRGPLLFETPVPIPGRDKVDKDP